METNLSTNLSNYNPYNSQETSLKALQAERTAAASVSTSKSMDVQLVTAEGDKVTISLDARAASLYGVSEKAEADENSISYQKTELSVSLYEREMTFTVEGELSDAEKRDIRKVLKTLDRMMNHMIHGDLQPMAANARRLKGLENIASLEAGMSYERTVLVAQQASATAIAGPTAAENQPPLPAPATAGDSSATAETARNANAVGDFMTRTLQASETPMERMMAFFDQLLADYRQRMSGIDATGLEMVDRVADRLRGALDQMNALQNEAA